MSKSSIRTHMYVDLQEFYKANIKDFYEIFPSEQEILVYFKKLANLSHNAVDDFYDILLFYKSMKSSKDNPSKFIMIVSLIEKLTSQGNYLSFSEWLNEQNIVGKIDKRAILRLWHQYNNIFGCSSKFRRFFKGDFLDKAEKISLLQSVKFFVKCEDGKNHLMPMFCYDTSHCYFREPFISCPIFNNLEKDDCLICNNISKLKKGLDELAEFLYYMRNMYAHNALLPRLAPPLETVTHKDGATLTMTTMTFCIYKFKRRKVNYIGWIFVELSVLHLESILNKKFKTLLDNYLTAKQSY
jgi:hypothetical protein